MNEITLYYRKGSGNPEIKEYPEKMIVKSEKGLAIVVENDHVGAEYINQKRSNNNFVKSNCVLLDIDNDHSDDPADWITPDDLSDLLPKVQFYAVASRNHLKPKKGKEARPKHHYYFPINETSDGEHYKGLKEKLAKIIGGVDNGALDIARFFFGVEEPKVETFDGGVSLDDYLKTVTIESGRDGSRRQGDYTQGYRVPETIQEGQRVSAFIKLVGSLKAKGLTDEAIRAAVVAENKGITKPLTNEELRKEVFPALERGWQVESSYKAAVDDGKVRAVKKEPALLIPKKASTIEKKSIRWLFPNYIPEGYTSLLAGDGGTGKTTLVCDLVSSISSGKSCILDGEVPEDWMKREPQVVMLITSEDSAAVTLIERLEKLEANLENILIFDIHDEQTSQIKTDGQELQLLVEAYKPKFIVLDPLQSFLDNTVQMGSRNHLRNALNPITTLCSKHETTCVILMHSNKAEGNFGRRRLADSADIWDIARSVLMVGETDTKGVFYLSHEKSNYDRPQKTIIYELDDSVAVFKGYSDKKDRDFITELRKKGNAGGGGSSRDDQIFIVDTLKAAGGEMKTKELDEHASAASISGRGLKAAKTALMKDKVIANRSEGFGDDKVFYTKLLPVNNSLTGALVKE